MYIERDFGSYVCRQGMGWGLCPLLKPHGAIRSKSQPRLTSSSWTCIWRMHDRGDLLVEWWGFWLLVAARHVPILPDGISENLICRLVTYLHDFYASCTFIYMYICMYIYTYIGYNALCVSLSACLTDSMYNTSYASSMLQYYMRRNTSD